MQCPNCSYARRQDEEPRCSLRLLYFLQGNAPELGLPLALASAGVAPADVPTGGKGEDEARE